MKLEDQPCDHTSRFAMQYMMQKRMDFPKVSGWLSQNGGNCDCKIIEEIAVAWWKIFDNLETDLKQNEFAAKYAKSAAKWKILEARLFPLAR